MQLLRHLGAADSALARANARALIEDWIRLYGRGQDWSCDLVARRLISWLSQSPLILTGADRDFYHRFMRSLARQAAWLERAALRLSLLDPQLVLERGYAWLSDDQGQALTQAAQFQSGQSVQATLSDGVVPLVVK